MTGYHDGFAGFAELIQHGHNRLTAGGIQVASWFIGEDHRRIVYQRAGNRHTLLLTTGKFRGLVANAFLETNFHHQVFRAFKTLFFLYTRKPQREGDVCLGGHVCNQVEALKDKADFVAAIICQRVFIHRVDLQPVNQDLTRSRPIEPAHQVEQGAFTRATGTHDHDERTAWKAQVQTIQGMDFCFAHFISFS